MHKIATVSLSLILFAQPLSAFACSAPRDIAALKTAALQQRLMVSALSCSASTAYNRFVMAHRTELQRSDADLKAYFTVENGEHGEAAYDTYKTRVANLAAHAPAMDTRAFCAATAKEFDSLSDSPDGLIHALAAERMPADVCRAPVLAAATPRSAPLRVATAEEVAGVAGALPAPPKSAPLKVTVEVGGVTTVAMPAMPYSAAPPPVARMTQEEVNPADILPPESYARDNQAIEAPRAAARRDEAYDDYTPPRLAYAPAGRRDDDYAPPQPSYASAARRSERYWYYRSL